MRIRTVRPLLVLATACGLLVGGGVLAQPQLSGRSLTAVPASRAETTEDVGGGPPVDVTAVPERVEPVADPDASLPAGSATTARTAGSSVPKTRPATTARPAAASSSATPTARATRSATASTTAPSGQVAQLPGWRMDYHDDFDVPIEQTRWVRYGWNDPPVGHGAMGVMSQKNSFTRDGRLVIRTQYEYDARRWSTGGAGSGEIFSAVQGRWEIRARFPRAKGIGYAFLLWPEDEGWPPEIDFAEGRVNGPQVMGVYHWDPDNKQEHRFFDNPDMSGWHTYGVIVEPDLITFTFDGRPWGEIRHPSVTTKRMWIGFQAGAMDPNGIAKDYETVDGGVPGPLTPAVNDIEIDWVAHYVRA